MGRPKQALITRAASTKAGLAAIDADGLDNFSLNSAARPIGVKAPSLYYRFQDKAELLAEVARLLLIEADYQSSGDERWEDSTVKICVETRWALLKHPNAAPLILPFFPRHLLLDAYEITAACYPQTRALHMAILEGIEKLTFGSALFAAAASTARVPAMPEVTAKDYSNLAESVPA